MPAARRAHTLVRVAVEEHQHALDTESPPGLAVGGLGHIVRQDEHITSGPVRAPCGAAPLVSVAIERQGVALLAESPVLLVIGVLEARIGTRGKKGTVRYEMACSDDAPRRP